jgi:hypothetical protein
MQAIISFTAVIILVSVVSFGIIALLQPTIASSTQYLEDRGYIVIPATFATDVTAIKAKTDNLPLSPANEITASAAVGNAAAAVIQAQAAAAAANATLITLLEHNENTAYVFSDNVSQDTKFTAGNGVDTFGAWAEIKDSGNVTLSSKFAAQAGYISQLLFREYSKPDEMYSIEIAYGDAKTVVARAKVRSDFSWFLDVRSVRIPAGQTIYYRMKGKPPFVIVMSTSAITILFHK